MRRIKKIIAFMLICWCILWCIPVLAYADSTVEPPTEVKTFYEQASFGWPGLLPNEIAIEWVCSKTEGVEAYYIYELVTKQDGSFEYMKVGSTGAENSYYDAYWGDVDHILGFHRFVVTAVMPDGRESDYSEIAESGIYRRQKLRDTDIGISSVTIEWDAPEFGKPDTYEIWYCEDEYHYWEYYNAYYGGGFTDSNIVYQKIKNLPEDTRKYTIKGLKPDIPYIFMVQSYQDGQALDRSDFLQARTVVPEWTQAMICYKDRTTGEIIKTETVDGLKPGKPYTYQPVPSFETEYKIYTLNGVNANQLLSIAELHGNPEKNVLTVYYMAKEKQLKVGRVSLNKPTRLSAKKAKVKWKKVSGAKGYQVVYADNAKFKKAKKKTTAKTAITLKKLKKEKPYYIKVRAYKLDLAGNKVYGKYSKKKKVTAR